MSRNMLLAALLALLLAGVQAKHRRPDRTSEEEESISAKNDTSPSVDPTDYVMDTIKDGVMALMRKHEVLSSFFADWVGTIARSESNVMKFEKLKF